jgi:hypothetical protein
MSRPTLICLASSNSGEGAWVHVAFSWLGLERLDAPSIETFPSDFRDGLFRRAGLLGDRRIRDWGVGGSRQKEAHAVVVVAANSPEDLGAELERQRVQREKHGLRVQQICVGAEFRRGYEHFGFHDGLSQPILEGSGAANPDSRAVSSSSAIRTRTARPRSPGRGGHATGATSSFGSSDTTSPDFEGSEAGSSQGRPHPGPTRCQAHGTVAERRQVGRSAGSGRSGLE